jgi:ATP-dependent RNA helicase DHX29
VSLLDGALHGSHSPRLGTGDWGLGTAMSGPSAAMIDCSAGLLERIRVECGGKRPSEEGVADFMDHIEEVNVDHERPASWMQEYLHQAVVMCIEEVQNQGFTAENVKESVYMVLQEMNRRGHALSALIYEDGKGGVSTRKGVSSIAETLRMKVMNDLLCRLSREDLPVYYADLSKTLYQAQVVHSAGPLANSEASEADDTERKAIQENLESRKAAVEEERRRRDAEAAAAIRQKELAERERESSKNWILQNAMYESSDEDEFLSSEHGSIEDWELWGDPEEIEKKRAEKARATMSMEDKVALIAHDMQHAKDAVAEAKCRGDKAALKEMGAIIGRLRREMGELGINDADLEAVGVINAKAVKNCALEQSSEKFDNLTTSKGKQSSSSSDAGDFALFDEDGAPDESNSSHKEVNAAYASIILNKSLRESINQKKKKVKGNQSARIPRKHPKAILQQLVQKEGWGAPRFEKLPCGGEKNPSGPQFRFQALIDVKHSKGKKSKTRLGMHRFRLVPELDGWSTTTEAQDAVSTQALMDLFAESDIKWELLMNPFDELVLEIAEYQGFEETEAEDRSREVDNFVAALLADKSLKWHSFDKDDEDNSESIEMQILDEELISKMKDRKTELDAPEIMAQSQAMFRDYQAWVDSDVGKSWSKKRQSLPVSQIKGELLRCLDVHDVVLVSGETGSGKTTQVPQIVLDGCLSSMRGANCSIVCTQPRRIAAMSVADRVSEERGEAGPGKRGAVVGYSVRFDSATNSTTRLEFCTTGILLRRLSSDPSLAKLSHVIVDEVHERTMQSDFLIAMLRDLVEKRRRAGLPLKVILMSATMNAEVISGYFNGCPVLSASGRTFPVQHLFLEDVYEMTQYVLDVDSPACLKDYQSLRNGQRKLENSSGSKNKALIKSNWGDQTTDVILNPNVDQTGLEQMMDEYSSLTVRNLSRVNEDRIDMDLVEHVVLFVHQTQDPGAILVFVPGMGEIDNLSRRLLSQKSLQGHVVVPLHSSISPKDQKNAFKVHPPGVRKIVISTNIAETSVTIEDIVYVVDTGRHKERRHDASRSMSMLVEDTVSVANANQRKGRAGRVRDGKCFSLYTRQCYEKRMKKYQTPEIMRVPLEEMILQIHHLRLSNTADEFLGKVLQPPHQKAVQGSIEILKNAGALTKSEDLTSLGSHLAKLPVDVKIGKILIMGAILQCLSPALSIAACLSHKSPFISSQDREGLKSARLPFLSKGLQGKTTIATGQQSDHLVLAAALQGWIDAKSTGGMAAASRYAKKYQMSVANITVIMDMRDQFASMLEAAGLVQTGNSRGRVSSGCKWYDDDSCPQNTHRLSPEVLKAALLASLYPSIALIDETIPGSPTTWHDGTGPVSIHPTSMLSDIHGGSLERPFVVYSEKMKTSKVFLRDCSVATPLSIVLFGRNVVVDHRSSLILVDGWIRIKSNGRCAAILMLVREKLDEMLRSKVMVSGQGEQSAQNPPVNCLGLVYSLLKEESDMLNWTK